MHQITWSSPSKRRSYKNKITMGRRQRRRGAAAQAAAAAAAQVTPDRGARLGSSTCLNITSTSQTHSQVLTGCTMAKSKSVKIFVISDFDFFASPKPEKEYFSWFALEISNPRRFCFILLTHEGPYWKVYRKFQPSYDIFRRWCQGLFRPQVPCTPSLYTLPNC